MKKFNIFLVIVLAIVICALAYMNFMPEKQADQDNPFDIFGIAFTNPTNGATTTTASSLPVKVLDNNADRKFASIQNDSDTDIYLHFGYFANASAASTTVGVNQGFRLLPNAANEFIINDEQMYTGQVWASSTAGSKNIVTIEK